MARSTSDNELPPYDKYEVFRRAFAQVNAFVEEKNYIAAYVLTFSILEDRTIAAYAKCYEHLNGKALTEASLRDTAFLKFPNRLHTIKVIDEQLSAKIQAATKRRNVLMHQMMWRLDGFSLEAIEDLRKLINEVDKAHKRFLRTASPTPA